MLTARQIFTRTSRGGLNRNIANGSGSVKPRTYATSPKEFKLSPTIKQLLDVGASGQAGPSSKAAEETTTTVCGWIKSIRKQKNVAFAVLTDGSEDRGLQAVLLREGAEDGILRRLTNGTAVQLRGKLVESPGKGQSHELVVDEKEAGAIVVLGECDPESYPIQKKTLTPEYLRDHTHLRARTTQIASMLRLRHTLNRRLSAWMDGEGFTSVQTPVVTGNDAEGAGEVFSVSVAGQSSPSSPSSSTTQSSEAAPPEPEEFFGRPAFLTVSHQLHLEAFATALSRVWTLSPCFRAEPSLTRRHLAEFWMLEAEWAFTHVGEGRPVDGVCNVVEAMLRGVVGPLLQVSSSSTPQEALADPDVAALWSYTTPSALTSPEQKKKEMEVLRRAFASEKWWPRLSYTQAVAILRRAARLPAEEEGEIPVEGVETPKKRVKFEFEPRWGAQLQAEHEKYLAEVVFGSPVFVCDYPRTLKPFYMKVNEGGVGERETVACFDLLVPYIGELVGGSVREERVEVLRESMVRAGLVGAEEGSDEAWQWYLDLRQYGGAPHAGFGMGFERLVAWVGGVENVRECVGMPRWAGRMLL
ncbi:hypothetical protein D9611_007274 [Ephemerocybe angulata]|uniref:asparagine--tRNA ligase n=1 Tax=Ephemerocybe angulata TaxID=980116 RepID=A0A8H5B2W1_9AGAR|nr:hypothetical protein D9611_007274 [Tulosesus angulatus]